MLGSMSNLRPGDRVQSREYPESVGVILSVSGAIVRLRWFTRSDGLHASGAVCEMHASKLVGV